MPKHPPLSIGAVCSAGASAIQAAYPMFRSRGVELRVVTHKPAGIEDFCGREGVPCMRIEERSKERFSLAARDWLRAQDVDFVVLFLDRLLSAAFVESIYTVNFHPALLPAFPGMDAVEQALSAKAAYLGATAHQATIELDAGPIISQSAYALSVTDYELSRLLDISFVQRLALLCNVIDSQLYDRSGTRGWQYRPPAKHIPGSAFISPVWLSEASEELIRAQARMRSMDIVV